MDWWLPRAGVSAPHALAQVEALIREARQIDAAFPGDTELLAHKYLVWVESAERSLGANFGREAIERLLSDRYWQIVQLDGRNHRVSRLIENEVLVQIERLDGLLTLLRRAAASMVLDEEETILVLDTNVFIYGLPVKQARWDELVDTRDCRIVVPLAVVDELDRVKDFGKDASHAARSALKDLGAIYGGQLNAERQHVRAHVSIQLLGESPGHVRQPRVDDEIIRQALIIESLTQRSPVIVTRDYGMRFRAFAASTPVLDLPPTFVRSRSGRE